MFQVKKKVVVAAWKPQMKRRFKYYDYILIAVSLISIAVYSAVKLVKRKRLRLPARMMIATLFALFGALICFAFVTTPAGTDTVGCMVLAAFTQFFFLSSLTWSNSIAISIVRSLCSLRITSQSKSTLIIYSLYSFGLPLVCTLLTLTLSQLSAYEFYNEVYETKVICFLGDETVLYALFLGPIYALVVANIVITIIVMVKIAGSGRVGATHDRNRTKKHALSCFKVSLCLGSGWVLLFLATMYDGLWPVMQVFVELQGFLVVVANSISWSCVTALQSCSYFGSSESQTGVTNSQNRPSLTAQTTLLDTNGVCDTDQGDIELK